MMKYIKELVESYRKNYPNGIITSNTLFVRDNINKIIELTDFLPDNSKVTERLYVIINNLKLSDLKCPICSNKKKFYTLTKGYNLSCSQSCSSKYISSRRDNSINIQIGKTLMARSDEAKRESWLKKHNTSVQRYGVNYQSEFSKQSYLTSLDRGTFKSGFSILKSTDIMRWREMRIKASETMLAAIDENGNNHYDRVHLYKVRDIDENGNNFYDRMHLKNLEIDFNGRNHYDRMRERNFELGNWVRPEDKEAYAGYTHLVWYNTRKQPIESLENFDKRGRTERGGFHLDHIFSILEGFKQNICPSIVGNIHNLRMIPGSNNMSKSSKCEIEIDELIAKIEKYK